ncbi:hypothetical protein AKJ09_08306 [Labilithrix luteola]|uniref:Uncharacterized protein n=1 Tax=Labilithrix luteola TaxID=1391654 RepID=A0A0K1Q7C2_9BACT|nr:hypothetical protein AKJ09_08306 [Labilithrix luteola]
MLCDERLSDVAFELLDVLAELEAFGVSESSSGREQAPPDVEPEMGVVMPPYRPGIVAVAPIQPGANARPDRH